MPEGKEIVINTGPIIALVAAVNDLKILGSLYRKVHVPYEVGRELAAQGPDGFAHQAFEEADCLEKRGRAVELAPILRNTLDDGEASVIQLAADQGIETVCIDEAAGRRMARLSGFQLTGSLGILLRAKREGHQISLTDGVARMKERGIFLSEQLIGLVLERAGES